MPIEKRWISPREAGLYLGLHVKTVYELVWRKQIPAVKVGGSVRIDKRRLEEDLERQLAKKGPKR